MARVPGPPRYLRHRAGPGRLGRARSRLRRTRCSRRGARDSRTGPRRDEPDVVVNCIGIVKQADAVAEPITTVRVNSLFPHELAALCVRRNVRLIHLTTDCVFSGRRGSYTEGDEPDPVDLYGRSSSLASRPGRRADPAHLDDRMGARGPPQGLLEWFVGQRGSTVSGFMRAVFSGLTARVLAALIAELAEHHPELDGWSTWAPSPSRSTTCSGPAKGPGSRCRDRS